MADRRGVVTAAVCGGRWLIRQANGVERFSAEGPETVGFRFIAEGGRTPETVQVEVAVQVIELVLDDDGRQAGELQLERLPAPVQRADLHRAMPPGHAAEVGERKASLRTELVPVPDQRHLGISEDGQRESVTIWIPVDIRDDLNHEYADRHVHLGSGNPHAVIIAHGIAEIIDEPAVPASLEIFSRDGIRNAAQHGTAEPHHSPYCYLGRLPSRIGRASSWHAPGDVVPTAVTRPGA